MKKRNLIDDFGGTQKYLVAKDIKNKYQEIVSPEYHLTIPKMVNTIIDIAPSELTNKSPLIFANQVTISPTKDKNILDAFKFFAVKLEDLNNEDLLKTRDAIIGIGYVNITSSTEEDSYTIFEILNARGLDLQDHELLKNYIMRYLQPIERRDDAKRIWEEIEADLGKETQAFFRHYAIHKYNYSNEKKKGISIYKSIQNSVKGRNVDKLLDDIKLKSSYYSCILTPDVNNIEYKIFTFFRRNRVEQFRPLILSLKHQFGNENISEVKYLETLKFLYTFFVCFKIIGEESSNKLSDTIYKYAYHLENDYSPEKLDECVESLKSKLPTIDLFMNSFKNIGWSNHWGMYQDSKNKERCKLVLELIEEYVSNREINMPVTIEHILPDSQSVDNAQIGNLFFLEDNLNRRCDNKALHDKYDIYSESNLLCPRSFVQRYREKDFQPHDRTKFLAKLIYNSILDIQVES